MAAIESKVINCSPFLWVTWYGFKLQKDLGCVLEKPPIQEGIKHWKFHGSL